MYHLGAAYALQASGGGADARWSVRGGSSGAFVAAPFAASSAALSGLDSFTRSGLVEVLLQLLTCS